MKFAVTGSRSLTRQEKTRAVHIFNFLFDGCGPEDELFHGGAEGIDTIASQVADSFGMKVTPIRPTTFTWHGPSGFKQRNKRIVWSVEDEGELIALHSSRSRTGGTIWTYNYARRRNVPAEWIDLTNPEVLNDYEPVPGSC